VEAGGEPMIFYTITYNNIQNRINEKRISHKFFFGRQKYNIINKTYKTPKVPPSKNKKPNKRGALKVI